MSMKSILKSPYYIVKPIVHTYVFELKKHKKHFLVFLIVIIAILILSSLIPYLIVPENEISSYQYNFLQNGLGFMNWFIIFGGAFFYAGIICAEYSDKTGYIVFPKINKYKLVIGKYFGNLTLLTGVLGVYYFLLGMIAIYYYGTPIISRYYLSFLMAFLYLLAVSAFVTFFSSFMPNVNLTIVITIILLFIVYSIITQIIVLYNPDMEPVWDLSYVSNLILYVLEVHFPTELEDRYIEISFGTFKVRTWIVPTIEMGIQVMLLYTLVCLILASIIFTRRQL